LLTELAISANAASRKRYLPLYQLVYEPGIQARTRREKARKVEGEEGCERET